MDKKLIFLFSLPRSGSTLFQRVLSNHSKISTVSEPWMLLPFVYPLKANGVFTEYSHRACHKAFNDFINELPAGKDDYFNELRKFSISLYQRASKEDSIYFLDKTPRYYLIIQEIIKIFPNAKFIFLFRNPVQILASIMKTWSNGSLLLYNNHIDLYKGPFLLANGYREISERSHVVHFDDFIQAPHDTINKVYDYLEINHEEISVQNIDNTKLRGRLGDPVGIKQYKSVEREPLEKWKTVLNTKIKLNYAKRYLDYLGADIINTLGYDINSLKEEVNQITAERIGFSDLFFYLIDSFIRTAEPIVFKEKLKSKIINKSKFEVHS
jgi:hypothetical protein